MEIPYILSTSWQTLTNILSHKYAFYIYYPLLLVLSLLLFTLTILILQLSQKISHAPPEIPWTGLQNKRIFPKLRACLRELTVGRKAINEGYETYSKNGKPFIIPALHWQAVVLPPSNAAWVAQQPESILSGNNVLEDVMGVEWLTHGPNVMSVLDFTVVRRDLTRQIMKLSGQVLEEVRDAFDEKLGLDTDEWKEVSGLKMMNFVAFRAANRIFVGLPLCRDKGYEKDVGRWTTGFGVTTIFLRVLIPEVLKATFMRVLAIPSQVLLWWATRHIRPMIRDRLALLANRGQEDSKMLAEDEAYMMRWTIDANAHKQDPRELEPANIAGKMILFNIFATSTTSTMAGLVLYDILAYEKASELLSELREEAQRYLPEVEQDATAIRSMVKLDSAIRESLRFNPMAAQGMMREVVAPGGVTTPDGIHLARGTHIQSIVSAMQRDVDIFGPGADVYDPLRHCKAEDEPAKQKGAVQISDQFLSFGLGRHACPGRFFAVHTMKLMLAYLLVHYEISPFEEKPKHTEIGEAIVPNVKQKIKLRRRKGV